MPSYVKEIATFAFYRTPLLAYVQGRTNTSLEGGYSRYSLLLRKQSYRVVPAILGLLVGLLPKVLTLGRTSPLQSPHHPQPLHHSGCFSGFLWPEDLHDQWLLPALQEVTGMPWTLQMSPASKDKVWAGNPPMQARSGSSKPLLNMLCHEVSHVKTLRSCLVAYNASRQHS